MLLLLPQHIPHNKNLSVPRGLEQKWQTALQLFSAQKPTGRSQCHKKPVPHTAQPPARTLFLEIMVLLGSQHGLEGKKGEIQPEFSSWPFTQTPKGKALRELYKESKPALSKTVYNPLWHCTQTPHVQACRQVCVGLRYSKECLGQRV